MSKENESKYTPLSDYGFFRDESYVTKKSVSNDQSGPLVSSPSTVKRVNDILFGDGEDIFDEHYGEQEKPESKCIIL